MVFFVTLEALEDLVPKKILWKKVGTSVGFSLTRSLIKGLIVLACGFTRTLGFANKLLILPARVIILIMF